MKNLKIIIIILSSLCANNLDVLAQINKSAPPIVTPVVTADSSTTQKDTEENNDIDTEANGNDAIIPGSQLSNGSGFFTDPVATPGLSIAANGAIFASNKSNSFGYDATAFNVKWVPGTNALGRRINLQLGSANWYTPALSKIYKSEVLDEKERLDAGESVNAWMFGIGIRLGSDRNIYKVEIKDNRLDELERKINKETSTITKKNLKSEYMLAKWEYLREASRAPTLMIGAMCRLGELSTETNVKMYDIYATGAWGKGVFDCIVSTRYLAPLEQTFIVDGVRSTSIAFLLDLEDYPPINTLGLTLGYSQTQYVRKERILDNGSMISEQPNIEQLDVTLSFSNLLGETLKLPFGTGLALRYSKPYYLNSISEQKHQISILFSTKFISSIQDKAKK